MQDMLLETPIFNAAPSGGAEGMSKRMGVPFLGRIPMDPILGQASEQGRSVFEDADSAAEHSVQSMQQDESQQHSVAEQPSASGRQAAQCMQPGQATLLSLQGIIAQLVDATEGRAARSPPGDANGHAEANGMGGAANGHGNGVHAVQDASIHKQQQQQQQQQHSPALVQHSNGDVPLDPSLHYRIHLGM